MKLRSVVRFGTDLARNPLAVRDLPQWLALYRRRGDGSPLGDEIPWLTFGAIRFLEARVRPDLRVFEWGSGGSTLYFTARCREVVSVEHDRAFHDRVKARLKERGRTNSTLLLEEPAAEGRCASRHPHHRGQFFDSYVATIERFPAAHFDLISVDGRQRNACARAALAHLKPGGLVLLDNSDRFYYRPGIEALRAAGFKQHRFPGFVPFASHQAETSVFSREPA